MIHNKQQNIIAVPVATSFDLRKGEERTIDLTAINSLLQGNHFSSETYLNITYPGCSSLKVSPKLLKACTTEESTRANWTMLAENSDHMVKCKDATSNFIAYPEGYSLWNHTFAGIKDPSAATIGKDGIVYVYGGDNYVYAFYGDGSIKWKSMLNGSSNLYAETTSATLADDGTVYLGVSFVDQRKGYLYAFDKDGTHKWRVQLDGTHVRSDPTIGKDGTIYVAAFWGYNLYAVNPDGTIKWTYPTAGGISASVSINYDAIYFGTTWGHGSLYALNFDRSLRWKHDLYPAAYPTPILVPDNTSSSFYSICTNSYDKNVYCFYPNNTMKFKTSVKGQGFPQMSAGQMRSGNDTLLFVNTMYDNYLYAIYASNGSIFWEKPEYDGWVSPGADGSLYICSKDNLYTTNINGEVRRSVNGVCSSSKSAAVGRDRVYTTSSGGKSIYAYSTGVSVLKDPYPQLHYDNQKDSYMENRPQCLNLYDLTKIRISSIDKKCENTKVNIIKSATNGEVNINIDASCVDDYQKRNDTNITLIPKVNGVPGGRLALNGSSSGKDTMLPTFFQDPLVLLGGVALMSTLAVAGVVARKLLFSYCKKRQDAVPAYNDGSNTNKEVDLNKIEDGNATTSIVIDYASKNHYLQQKKRIN